MKRLLSYTFLMVLSSLVATSCIFEKFDDGSEPLQTSLCLKLCFPEDDMTKAPAPILPGDNSHTHPDSTEYPTNSYENTIPSASDIRIFLFDATSGDYLDEVHDLTLDFVANKDKTITGSLSESLIGKTVKMVFMANYEYRMNARLGNPLNAPYNQKYSDWKSTIYFAYNVQGNDELVTMPKDDSLIPMSGETEFTVVKDSNKVQIQVTRALAKVRLKVRKGSGFGIQNISVKNSAGYCYCFKKVDPATDALLVPDNKNFGSFRQFNVTLGEEDTYEFYVAEQVKDKMLVDFELFDLNNSATTISAEVVFKDYPDGLTYPVERNHIYEFNINKNKIADSKVDISTSVQDWTPVDLNTEFE